MSSCRNILLAVFLASFGVLYAAPPGAAQGFGSFALCYERLKQLVAILEAQGQTIDETVDEPRDKRYVVVTTFGERQRIMSCTPKGDLVVEDEVIEAD